MGVTQGAGLSLQWFRNQFAPGTDYDTLMTEAATAPVGSHGLFWLPYMMGERTPHLDATARGGWIGVTARHTRADMIRSLIEGVSYSQKDCLDLIEGMGVPVDSVRVSGGGARSKVWRQILSDVLKKKVATLESQDGSAYGAALLAMTGTGAFSSVPEACKAVIKEVDSTLPRPHESQHYARGHEVYRMLYPTLKPIYSLITNLR
jgi:xylulokinase